MPKGCQLPRQAHQNDEQARHGRKAFTEGTRENCGGRRDESGLSESSYQHVGDHDRSG